MKALILLLGFAACIGCLSTGNLKAPGRTILGQRISAVQVVGICVIDGKTEKHFGSGVIISETQVLTAAHVMPCSDGTMLIAQPDSDAREMVVEYINAEIDVTRARLAEGYFAGPRVDVAKAIVGSQVCIASGIPTRDYKCGLVEEFKDRKSGNLASTAPVEPGNSGSGLYDRKGRLVGIVTHQRNSSQGVPVGGLATSLYEHPEVFTK